jgi:cephalosporin-C deacetylase-like acetyl esterase
MPAVVYSQQSKGSSDYLNRLLKVLPEDRKFPEGAAEHVSPQDFTWHQWLRRTGSLPPDFDKMPTLPFLPDPLIIDEGGKNIPVRTMEQWNLKREQIKELAQYWITGTIPPSPDNMKTEVLREKKIGELTERDLLLTFGPGNKGQLHITLLIPPGKGPFPVFICQWIKDNYSYVQAAVRRGYIGCRFTATDPKYGYPDDSEGYEKMYWPKYDFTTIMRWAWAASRTIDYLYTLNYVNREQIALTGLSRNGKMALWAAAYDDRIKAVVPISGGTGGEDPFRYTSFKYNVETIERISYNFPHWTNPRLKFFVGHECKLPVDQNSLMALIAPRGLMISSALTETDGNPWGIEQAYLSARKTYEFLGAEDKIALDLRWGLHAPAYRDIEKYLDFFDFVFKRGKIKPQNQLIYDYSFSKWLAQSGENIDPLSYPEKSTDDLLMSAKASAISNTAEWEQKLPDIRKRISWGMGVEPPSVGPGPQSDYLHAVVGLPRVGSIQNVPLLFGNLYFPAVKSSDKLPVVIYLHGYAYSTGKMNAGNIITMLTNAGYAVYLYDQIGFGSRNTEESRLFYDRFPHWSKMGRMAADVRWAVDALSENEKIDNKRIYVAGYSLGGNVALYSAALDERIAGVVSVCGFTPMRTNSPGKTAEGIYEYSHLHGLLPRLGFFAKNESHIPYDYHEILACIAPRPLLLIAPSWDQYASNEDIKKCVNEAGKVYALYGAKEKLELDSPDDYNRFSDEMKNQMVDWLKEKLKE